MSKGKTSDKTILAATGYIDFSNDTLSLMAAGVYGDAVVPPVSFTKNGKKNPADRTNPVFQSHVAYDPSIDYSTGSMRSSGISWGRVGLVCAGAALGAWGILKVSKMTFNGVAEMLMAGRRTNGQPAKEKPVRAANLLKQ